MLKWWVEDTVWKDSFPNGAYLFDGSNRMMYAFKPLNGPVKVFSNPIGIETRGRKFSISPVQYPSGVVVGAPVCKSWKVQGSKGQEYVVTESGDKLTCTCSGFKFRGQCKHATKNQTT